MFNIVHVLIDWLYNSIRFLQRFRFLNKTDTNIHNNTDILKFKRIIKIKISRINFSKIIKIKTFKCISNEW